MVDWESSGFDQKFGSATFFSVASSSRRSRAASKILPQVFDLLLERGEFAFEFFDHGGLFASPIKR
jgi:hypothetical protein